MKRPEVYCGIALLAALPLMGSAQERRVSIKDLPPAVRKTVKEQSKGAVLKGISKEVENGKTEYEAELRVNGHGKDVSMDPEGNITEIEEEVRLAALAAGVQTGIKKGAGTGRILKVESITQGGHLVAYEAQVRKGTKRSEVQVGPDGKPLAKRID